LTVHPSLKFDATAGPDRIGFQGRLTRRTALAPGRYRLTVVAIDGAGNRSASRRASFLLLPPKVLKRG